MVTKKTQKRERPSLEQVQPLLIPARNIPTFCHMPLVSYPDWQGTLWHCRPMCEAFPDTQLAF